MTVTTRTHGAWTTRNGGGSWKEAKALPFLSAQRLTVDPQQPGVVYTTTYGAGVWAPPDVYVRDNPQDTGGPPIGAVGISPDIIIRNAPVADPQAAFGEGSGTENNTALSDPVFTGHDYVLYVRVRNRGRTPAKDVTATVYYAKTSTMVPPPWTKIGTITMPTIDTGNKLTVSGPIPWPASQVPQYTPGNHYCLVAVLNARDDPAPDVSTIQTWPDFVSLALNENNITWYNFDVLKLTPLVGDERFVSRPFLIAGAMDRELRMDIEIGVDPPGPFPEVEVLIELPLTLLRNTEPPPGLHVVEDQPEMAQVALADKPILIAGVPLPTGSRTGCRLLLRRGDQGWDERVRTPVVRRQRGRADDLAADRRTRTGTAARSRC